MRNTHNHPTFFLLPAIAVVTMASMAMGIVPSQFARGNSLAAAMVAPHGAAASQSMSRTALRLQERIERRFGWTLRLRELTEGITQQRTVFSHMVTVRFTAEDGSVIPDLPVSLDRFALWLQVTVTPAGMETAVNVDRAAEELSLRPPEGVRLRADATLLSSFEEDGILKATTDGVARSGHDFDARAVAATLAQALQHGTTEVQVPLTTVPGVIRNATGDDLGSLTLLASGQSNFAGSGQGRKANVRKGLNEKITNLLVPAGDEFSINDVFKNVPLREWQMALGIFNGGDLRPVQGGGICQVATTLYRGILNAGLPVTQRTSHSLFVHYYEKYGVGIDATIFPASNLDLRFANDTGQTLLIQSYTEGDEATVNIYGTPDGRIVRLTGPYFAENAPEEFRVHGKKLTSREIAWVRTVTYGDGRTTDDTVLSRYKFIPQDVVNKYGGTVASITTNVHAAASQHAPLPQQSQSDLQVRAGAKIIP